MNVEEIGVMANNWQTVRLGSFLTERKEFITIDDFADYKRARVQLHGKGIVVRDEVQGVEIKTKSQQVARIGEFLVAEIDAKVGGFGIVPSELNDAIVSGHYFLFEINEKICLQSWLDWFIRWGALEEQVTARGSTNYATIRPNDVIEFTIPLPPLTEQQRIVARVDALARRVEEARGLRRAAEEEGEALASAASGAFFDSSKSSTPKARLEEFTTRITKGESPEWQGFNYQDTGPIFVRSENVLWGKLDLSKRTHIPSEFHQKLIRSQLRPRDVLINLVGASIGRACVVPDDIGEANVNQAVAVISPIPEKLQSEYLMHFLISRSTQDVIHSEKVETARPNISLIDVRNITIPLPPLADQLRIVAYLDGLQGKVDELRRLQAATQKELDALMPSILAKAFAGELV